MAQTKNPSAGNLPQTGKKVKRNVSQAIYLLMLMKLNGISQAGFAQQNGVSQQMINQIVWGTRKSKRLQESLAHSVGFSSWDQMLAHQTQAEQLFKAMKRGA